MLAPPLISTVIDMPFPPSVNRIWRAQRGGMGKAVRLSEEYVEWKKQTDLRVMVNRTFRGAHQIKGPFEAHIALNMDEQLGDLDNRAKAVMDWAQSRELISDDKFCMRLTIEWVLAEQAPDGCRLTLRELPEAA